MLPIQITNINQHYKNNRIVKKQLLLLSLSIILSANISGQEKMTVAFYNVENLFDTVDNPATNDDEFTPEGDRRWNSSKYWNKLEHISQTLVAIDQENSPEIIGLCEIENETVIKDLTERSPLRHIGYSFVVTESKDARGIDVALIFKKSYFRLIKSEELEVNIRPINGKTTRNILHVTGRVATGDTVDIYVCHWPSRLGGVNESDPLRAEAAKVLNSSVNQVTESRRKPYIIVMGDMNDGCESASIRDILRAKSSDRAYYLKDDELVTLLDNCPDGSYRYNGEWDTYDQLIVSGSFTNELGCLSAKNARICNFDFLLEDDTKYGGKKPFRNFNGYRYQNGYSDHLPIAFDIEY